VKRVELLRGSRRDDAVAVPAQQAGSGEVANRTIVGVTLLEVLAASVAASPYALSLGSLHDEPAR
jgi:hypothetical protein